MDGCFPPVRRVYESTEKYTKVLVIEHQPESTARGQVVLLHGLEGSSEAGYFKSLAQAALLRGFGVHRSNMRTCGDTESLSETMYHSGLTSDTRFILERIRETKEGPLFVVGFSLGGNVALSLRASWARMTYWLAFALFRRPSISPLAFERSTVPRIAFMRVGF